MQDTKEIISKRITELCKERGGVLAVSKATDIAESLLHRYLKGKLYPHIINLIKLSIYFGVSIDYLVGRED